MFKKKSIIVLLLSLSIFFIPTLAYASLFYNLYGYTNVSYISSGVNIYASSYTDDSVDMIQVVTRIWDDGAYWGFHPNAANDTTSVYISTDKTMYGYIQAASDHDAFDWTGDESMSSYDEIYR